MRLTLPPGAFRLLLAVAVVVSHISRIEIGRVAVLLFFFLSGYWVTRIWSTKFGAHNLAQFYGSRYFRIAPLYLLAMLASAVALNVPVYLENITLLGVASSGRDPTGVSWSLDIELQFYLLTPALAAMLLSMSPRLIILCTSALTLAGWLTSQTFGIVSVAQYLPVFQLGALASLHNYSPSRRTADLSLAAFAVTTILFALLPATSVFLDKTRPNPIDQDIFAFIWLLPLLPYVAHSLTQKSGAIDRHLGNLSYPLYLIHFPLIEFATRVAGDGTWVKLSAAAASCCLAVFVYVLIDRPIDTLRSRVFERRTSPIHQPSKTPVP